MESTILLGERSTTDIADPRTDRCKASFTASDPHIEGWNHGVAVAIVDMAGDERDEDVCRAWALQRPDRSARLQTLSPHSDPDVRFGVASSGLGPGLGRRNVAMAACEMRSDRENAATRGRNRSSGAPSRNQSRVVQVVLRASQLR
jgi:hypothetical protein